MIPASAHVHPPIDPQFFDLATPMPLLFQFRPIFRLSARKMWRYIASFIDHALDRNARNSGQTDLLFAEATYHRRTWQ